MADADGYVRIDTKLNTSGFNAGVSKLKSTALTAMNSVLFATAKVGTGVKQAMTNAMSTVSKLGTFLKHALKASLLVLGASIAIMFGSIRDSLQKILDVNLKGSQLSADVDAIKNKFTELKASIVIALLPVLQAVIPFIKSALNWLITFFNKAAMFIGAFFGQTQVLQVVPGSAAQLSNEAKSREEAEKKAKADAKSAKEKEKAAKAARGELAAFDQIDVLQQKQIETPEADIIDTSGIEQLAEVTTQMVPVTDEIFTKVQKIKDEIWAWWNDPIGKLKETWGKIAAWFNENVIVPIRDWWNSTWLGQILNALWENFTGTWRRIWENTVETFENIKEHIKKIFAGVIEVIRGIFTNDWSLVWQGLKDIVTGVFGVILELIRGWIENVKIFFSGWVTALQIIWKPIVDWFNNNILNPLRAKFESFTTWLKDAWHNAFTNLASIVKGPINTIIGFINGMMRGIAHAINTIADTLSNFKINLPPIPFFGFPGLQWSAGGLPRIPVIQVPYLATGAVIPPNSQFLAMLGDQRSGRNIEAPEGLIRQIVREELGAQEITINFAGNLGALVRELKPHIDRENKRIGAGLKGVS